MSALSQAILGSIWLVLLVGCDSGSKGGTEDRTSGARSLEWQELLKNQPAGHWQRLDFDGMGGQVDFTDGILTFSRGEPFTGVVITDQGFAPPADEYELVVRARKTDGRDFFCALTFPVPEKQANCTFVAGGWGGGVTGLSNIDHLDANRNTTRSSLQYETGRWYDLRIEIRTGRIRCWVDERLVVNSIITGKHISMRPGPIEACQPLGLASWETAAEFESLRVRALPPE